MYPHTYHGPSADTEIPDLLRQPPARLADILLELGMMYCIGRDVAQDYVTAHKWFNLAALKGSEDAKLYRRELALEMTPAQVAEAQRQARAWLTLH